MDAVRQAGVGLRLLLVMTVVLGLLYPVAVWAASRPVAGLAEGSLVEAADGRVRGSELVGQPFDGDEWFLPRPSAGDHDPLASGGSNLGPENDELVATVLERRAEVAARERVPESQVPPDAVAASWSGVDPHISPEYAALQVRRVAEARGLDPADVRALVDDHSRGRQLGFLGAPRVNVVTLNLALDGLDS
jgi:K+-transporting ATPase ATPase C chain